MTRRDSTSTSDSTTSIFHSAKRFLSGTFLSRLSGLLRDVAMAFAFGTEPAVAALMVAFRFSHFFRRLLGEGALQMAFIPHFERLRVENPQKAVSFFKNLTAVLCLILTLVVLISIVLLLSLYFFVDFSSDNREIIFLTALLMPGLFFICLYGINASLLQCENHYFTSSIAPVAFNGVWIAGALLLQQGSSGEAMLWLCAFIVCACAGQWLMTVPTVWRLLKQGTSTLFCLDRPVVSPEIKRFISPFLLGIAGVAATQINSAVDPLFARYADSAGPAYLWYAIRLEQFPLALFGIALSSALMPPLARAIQNQQMDRYRQFLNDAVRISVVLMLPMTCAYLIAGDTCVNLVFGHGDFNSTSTVETTRCLWAYALGILPTALTLLLAPAFYSLHDYRTPTVSTCVSVGMNLALNSLFVFGLSMGSASVAYATSASAWINFFILSWVLKKKIDLSITGTLIRSGSFTLLFCLGGVLSVLLVDDGMFQGNNFGAIFWGETPVFSRHFAQQIGRFFVEALSFSVAILPLWWLSLRSPQGDILIPKRL